MSFIANKYLKSNIIVLNKIVRIIASKDNDKALYQIVEQVINDDNLSELFQKDYGGFKRSLYKTFQNAISITEITHALLKIHPAGTLASYIRLVVDRLIEKQILLNDANGLVNVFSINYPLIRYLVNETNLIAYLLGFSEIVDEFASSIFILEHTPIDASKNRQIGTGFYQGYSNGRQQIRFVITNEHVVRAATVRILTKDEKEVFHSDIIVDNRGLDLAAIIIDECEECPNMKHMYFAIDYNEIVDEIIILGYPPISTTLKPYLLVHKGEINAIVQTREANRDMIVFSAKTFPGNSGGPILNQLGRVVGIVTESVEVKVSEDGKELKLSDYYMGIPAAQIVEFINDQVLPMIIKDNK